MLPLEYRLCVLQDDPPELCFPRFIAAWIAWLLAALVVIPAITWFGLALWLPPQINYIWP